MPEDWEPEVVSSGERRELARETGALKGLRKDKSEENLRGCLIHLFVAGDGCASKEGGVGAVDVALLKRLKKSRDWLRAMCLELFRDGG